MGQGHHTGRGEGGGARRGEAVRPQDIALGPTQGLDFWSDMATIQLSVFIFPSLRRI